MRKPVQKIVALCCVGAMAICFASCKPDPDTKTTVSDTAPSTSEGSTAAPDSTTPGAPAPTTPGAPTPTTPGAPAPTGVVKPADKAAAAALFNSAIEKITATSAKVTRALSEVKAGPLNILDLVDGIPEAFAMNDADLAGAALSKLDAASVASMAVTEAGDNYVIKFALTDVALESEAATVVANGHGGYMYLLDYNTVSQTINTIGKTLGGDAFTLEIKELKTINLLGGVLTATISKTTGKLSAATITFSEKLSAKIVAASLPGPLGKMPVVANVTGNGTVNYTLG